LIWGDCRFRRSWKNGRTEARKRESKAADGGWSGIKNGTPSRGRLVE